MMYSGPSTILRADARVQLEAVEPSYDGLIHYYPCTATMADGSRRDRMLLSSALEWEQWRKRIRAAPGVEIRPVTLEPLPASEIVSLADSPFRLPARFATALYEAGESGMGYVIFTAVFRDGRRQAYSTGNWVDFIECPEGATGADIVEIIPHEGRNDPSLRMPLDLDWCPFSV